MSTIIIHHHHEAYRDRNGKIWMSSVLGRWVQSISEHVDEVRLLLYESDKKLIQHDTQITTNNVFLFSLGSRKKFPISLLNLETISHASKEASKNADWLLIRGITPHQYMIWKFTNVKNKAFLLVGSMKQKKVESRRFLLSFLIKFVKLIRNIELRSFVKNNTLMLANSPLLANEISELLKKKAIFVPTNSIKLLEFSKLEFRELSSPLKLFYCGRIDLKKGLRELFYAIDILKKIDIKCTLNIVGDINSPDYTQLVNLSIHLGIEDYIFWSGFIPFGDRLFLQYQKSDIFVLPSYSEGFPHAIWESMANCCPVISTSVGGIPYLIENEKHALLIKPGEIEPIADSIIRVMDNKSFRDSLIKNAYYHAKSYSLEACTNKLMEVLRN